MPDALRLVPGAIQLDPAECAASQELGGEPLEKLQREHALILRAAGEGIYGLDLDGRATFINPAAAALTGHSVDELIGQRMHDVVHHSHPNGAPYPACDCPIYAAIRDGMVRQSGNEVFWRKDGSSFSVDFTSTPIVEGGSVIGAVVVFRDVTARTFMENRLRQALDEVRALKERLQEENSRLRQRIEHDEGLRHLIGSSPALARVLDLVRRAAAADVPVLVQGESGTGKELVCRAIHDLGPGRARPFVAVNCAAISPALIESELFGHEKGAFTGAHSQRSGRFEQAEDGTLFLDEVGELPLDCQAKLLRVLQEHTFQRVGGSRELHTSARIVAATNRDLRELVRTGRFRADLYYRLYVLQVLLPPLRERASDVPMLAEHFRRRCEAKWQRSFDGFDAASMKRLKEYAWPGNVRELEHAVERAVLLCDGPRLVIGELGGEEEARETTATPGPSGSGDALADVERDHIVRVLASVNYRISGPKGAAARLGMHPNTLRYRMSKLGIERPA